MKEILKNFRNVISLPFRFVKMVLKWFRTQAFGGNPSILTANHFIYLVDAFFITAYFFWSMQSLYRIVLGVANGDKYEVLAATTNFVLSIFYPVYMMHMQGISAIKENIELRESWKNSVDLNGKILNGRIKDSQLMKDAVDMVRKLSVENEALKKQIEEGKKPRVTNKKIIS